MPYDDRPVVQFLQATHGTDLLSDLERHLIGLAVTITRGCQVCTRNRIVKAHDAGIPPSAGGRPDRIRPGPASTGSDGDHGAHALIRNSIDSPI